MAPVDDGETLYRSVMPAHVVWEAETWKLSSQAFNDTGNCPSVDLASLRGDPVDAQLGENDGIAQLIAQEVRQVKVLQNPNANPADQVTYAIDVLARPLPNNPAHAQIEPAPAYSSNNHFRKIKEALCRLAEKRPWVIEPTRTPVEPSEPSH